VKDKTGELEKANWELEQANRSLLTANKAKDEFLSVMSHELRTPLNVVIGYGQMIKDGLLGQINPEQERALEKVIRRSQDLLTMINEIMQATSIEAGAVKLEIKEVHLEEFLEDLRSGYEIPMNKDLGFNWDYPPDLGSIRTDVDKLKHILQNLINNAIKFTDKGYVTISARCSPGTKGAEFEVADTGIGIQKELLPSIFEMFRQLDSSETRAYGGVGIGLYIVKKYTEMLGGKIRVESEVGKGSVFNVTIPC
jgi:signal transduction histidine kinase